ncbi:hypothetical protein ACLKMH_05525 [Psychromonas sp. KJ10-10]|uniref:hypothetical protein n=1 Tax=Psychromonas sp. KJ10-10 TaxID=3391823 RepID=UPI0039B412B9
MLFLICLPIISNAMDFDNCKVIEIVTEGKNNANIRLNCLVTNGPAYANAGDYVGFDKSTDAGKQYMSVFLTAFASSASVAGLVNDTYCSLYQGNVALIEHLRMTK